MYPNPYTAPTRRNVQKIEMNHKTDRRTETENSPIQTKIIIAAGLDVILMTCVHPQATQITHILISITTQHNTKQTTPFRLMFRFAFQRSFLMSYLFLTRTERTKERNRETGMSYACIPSPSMTFAFHVAPYLRVCLERILRCFGLFSSVSKVVRSQRMSFVIMSS